MNAHGLKRIRGTQLAMTALLRVIGVGVLWALIRPAGAHTITRSEATASSPAGASAAPSTPITAIAMTSSSEAATGARMNDIRNGHAHTIVDEVGKVPELNVPTGTPRWLYKSGNVDVRQITNSSGVGAEFEARAQNAGESVRIASRSVVAPRGFQRSGFWSEGGTPMKGLPIALAGDPPNAGAYFGEAATSEGLTVRTADPLVEDAATEGQAQTAGSTAFAVNKHKPASDWGVGDGKSHWVPAYEIVGFEFLLNQYDRHVLNASVYGTNFSTFRHNLSSGWIIDTDPFQTNQFLHPYQGSIFHGFARSAGLSFWESMAYAFGGSLLWKEAGETGKPSINDQVTTTFAGPILGEPLFRMASLLLERGGSEPGFWRELGAAAIAPTMGFNRLVFGDRFRAVFPSHEPSFYTRLKVGATVGSTVTSNVNVNPDELGTPASQAFAKNAGIVDFSMSYGLPGKPGYTYDRPFDYFHFEFEASTANIFENIISRGLLYGTSYEVGDNYRGIWGLYGSYDYIDPQIFRISSTAASLGTTGEWWLSKSVAVQGTTLGGVGFGAAGTIHGSGQRDYHYGLTPQGLLALRLILGDRVTLDVTGREFYVSGVASTESRGSETILRAEASLTLRIYHRQAITLGYVTSTRNAHYPDLPDTHQSVGTVGVYYTLLGDTKFGLRDWRSPGTGETAADTP